MLGAMIGGQQVIYVSIFLLISKSFRHGHSLKNDPSLQIIDVVDQEENCPDPIKNIKTKTMLSIHKDKKKNLIF